MHEGEAFRLERLPLGSRVIYPPESLPGIVDLEHAIRHALLHPHGSDPLVYVNLPLTARSGGSKSVAVGLASYASLRHHHNVHTLRHSRSFNDPPNSAMHHSYDRMADLIGGHVPVFTVETTLNNEPFPAALRFLTRREWE